jgi:chemotaxis protein methyltransferase CheR
MDLILCRNLIIYFSPAQARRLIGNLRRSLADDGWLVVSPSECSQALFTGFSPVNFPGSIFYRRCESRCESDGGSAAAEADTATPPAPLPTPPRVRSLTEREVEAVLASAPAARASDATPHDSASLAGVPAARAKQGDAFSTAEAALARGEHAVALEKLQSLLTTADGAEKQRALGLLTRALANAGSLAEALKTSEQWIALDKLDPAAHYVNALVLQELGERARARAALHRAVYLEPGFALAHFALGNHARAEARGAEARRHFDNASRLLAGLEADQLVPESEGLTAGQLREIIVALGRDA